MSLNFIIATKRVVEIFKNWSTDTTELSLVDGHFSRTSEPVIMVIHLQWNIIKFAHFAPLDGSISKNEAKVSESLQKVKNFE